MENIEMKVGVSVPAWTYHECDNCGCIYPISRCSVKTVTEKDLMCQECWDAQVISDKEDEISEMKKEIEECKALLIDIRKNYECGKSIDDEIDSLLAKYNNR